MTTQKTLRKACECIILNKGFEVTSENSDELTILFAKYFYPRTFKISPKRAIKKTLSDIEVCLKLGYLYIHNSEDILEDYIELSKTGAARIESKSDSLRNLFIRVGVALCGIASTVGASFLIDFIKSLLQ